MNILVRNLPKSITGNELLQWFQPFGTIKSYNIVLDQATGKSKGFGFVDMPDNAEAVAAIKALDGKLFHSVKIRVKAGHQIRTSLKDNRADARPERAETREKKKVSGGRPGGARNAKPARPERTEKRGKSKVSVGKPGGYRSAKPAGPERAEARGKRKVVGGKPGGSRSAKPARPQRAETRVKRNVSGGKPGGARSAKTSRPKREGRR